MRKWIIHTLLILNIIIHPVFLPIFWVWWYFYSDNPHYPMSYANLLSNKLKNDITALYVFLLTIMPILILLLTRGLRLTSSIILSDIKERRYFFLLMGIYYWMIFYTLKDVYFHEFIRPSVLLIAAISVISFVLSLLSFSQFKLSLHAAGYGVLVGFFAGCGILFNDVYINEIILSVILSALVMIIRLISWAHTILELLIGWILGCFSSIFVFWLTYQYS
jgi:membrane-associated phospholipid phosphatase